MRIKENELKTIYSLLQMHLLEMIGELDMFNNNKGTFREYLKAKQRLVEKYFKPAKKIKKRK